MARSADCLAVAEPAFGGKSALYEFDGSNPSPHHPALSVALDASQASVSFLQELDSHWQSELARLPRVAA